MVIPGLSDAVSRDILLVDEFTALVEAERHDGAYEVGGGNDGGPDVRLLDVVDERLVGQSRGVVDLLHLSLLGIADIRDVGHSRDDVHIELAVQPLLHNFHVEQAEEAATEAEAEGHRRLGRKRQRGIVQLQFLERGTQVLVLRRVDRIDTGKDHRLHLLEALDSGRTGACHVGNGVAHLNLL